MKKQNKDLKILVQRCRSSIKKKEDKDKVNTIFKDFVYIKDKIQSYLVVIR